MTHNLTCQHNIIQQDINNKYDITRRWLSPDGPDLPGGAVGLGAVTQRLAAEPEHGGGGGNIMV